MSTAVSYWWPTPRGWKPQSVSAQRPKAASTIPAFMPPGSLPISALASSPRACLISRPRPSSPPKASPPAPLPESRSSWKKAPGPSACTPAGPPLPASPPPAWPSTVSGLPHAPMRASSASSTPTSSTRRRPIDLPAELATLGSVWELAETAVKPYPVCHFIHGCADAAIDLHQQIDAADIVRAEALLPRDTMPIVAEPRDAKIRPANEYEAKFSAQFVVATCLLKGAFGLADLMPAALKDPAVLDLAARVTCTIDPDSAFPAFFSGGVRLQH